MPEQLLFSGRIVGYSIDERIKASLAAALRLAIVTWIERTYHCRGRQRAPAKLTPIEFEAVYRAARAA
jgi:putative transposase